MSASDRLGGLGSVSIVDDSPYEWKISALA